MYGIEVAIKKLRPGCRFTLIGLSIEDWEHQLPPPTMDEIVNQLGKDMEEHLLMGGEIIE